MAAEDRAPLRQPAFSEGRADVRDVLQRLFTRAGFTVHTAPDGRAALELDTFAVRVWPGSVDIDPFR